MVADLDVSRAPFAGDDPDALARVRVFDPQQIVPSGSLSPRQSTVTYSITFSMPATASPAPTSTAVSPVVIHQQRHCSLFVLVLRAYLRAEAVGGFTVCKINGSCRLGGG